MIFLVLPGPEGASDHLSKNRLQHWKEFPDSLLDPKLAAKTLLSILRNEFMY